MKKPIAAIACLLTLFSVNALFAADQRSADQRSADQQAADSRSAAKLKIGILPDLDSLPILAGLRDGLYQSAGVTVELVSFKNPVERDAAFQAGTLDGIVSDTLGAVFSCLGGGDGVIVSVTTGRYGLAASPKSGCASIRDLAGKNIGISSNTVIEYVASTLMTEAGVPSEAFHSLAVAQMPVRLELLLADTLPGACLPEPLYSIAVSRGAIPLGDSGSLSGAPGVLMFTRASVKDKKAELSLFFGSYQKECARINANPENYRALLVESVGVPENLKGSFKFVTYEMPRLPRPDEIDLVTKWMLGKKLISRIPSYGELTASLVIQ